MAAVPGPLNGVRVIDMTTVVMGPYATQILGDYGADVIKVESPKGDSTRALGPARNPGMGHIFLHANRNKRSVVLDLKQPEGLEALLYLIRSADVLISNVRAAAMARLGLSYAKLSETNPRLIMVGLVGYGQRGPYAAKPAYDDLLQGLSGVASLSAVAGGSEPRYAPVTLSDRTVALSAVNAVLGGLYHRERTGEGQEIEIPMFETTVQFVMGDHLGGLSYDPPIGTAGYARLLSRDRRPYATRDGYICVMVYTDDNWRDFLAEIGQPALFDRDPRFATLQARTQNISALYALVADAMRGRTTRQWLDVLDRLDIPAMPMHTADSLIDDAHLKAIDFFRIVEHPSEGKIREMDIPGTWSKTQPTVRRRAPLLGEHTAEVLREFGMPEELVVNLLNPSRHQAG